MNAKTETQNNALETFLLTELELNKMQVALLHRSQKVFTDFLEDHVVKNEDNSTKDLTLIVVSPAEREILIQSLGARKKLLRGKIRNNEGHMQRMDLPSWTEKDYQKAIKMRKLQLADADMLKTRIENLF